MDLYQRGPKAKFNKILNNMIMAKKIVIIPEILSIITKEKFSILDLMYSTPKLRISHHNDEPMKTPATKAVAKP